jgi:hypothetical protein
MRTSGMGVSPSRWQPCSPEIPSTRRPPHRDSDPEAAFWFLHTGEPADRRPASKPGEMWVRLLPPVLCPFARTRESVGSGETLIENSTVEDIQEGWRSRLVRPARALSSPSRPPRTCYGGGEAIVPHGLSGPGTDAPLPFMAGAPHPCGTFGPMVVIGNIPPLQGGGCRFESGSVHANTRFSGGTTSRNGMWPSLVKAPALEAGDSQVRVLPSRPGRIGIGSLAHREERPVEARKSEVRVLGEPRDPDSWDPMPL